MNALRIDPAPAARRIDLAAVLGDRLPIEPIWVGDLHLDSRAVRPGDAFVAVAGRRGHGLDHLAAACRAGAIAVLWDPSQVHEPPALPAGVRGLPVPGLAADLAALADRAYGSPSLRADVVGITGTNGKTTTAWLVAAACQALGQPAGYVGTLGAGLPPDLAATTHTTPDVFGIQATLAGLVARGARQIAVEVSSQGLDQGRTRAVRLRAAGFTNLTRDHLDYHGTMEAYGAAKARLFDGPGLGTAVINVADPFGATLAAGLRPGTMLIAVQPADDAQPRFVRARSVTPHADGLCIEGASDRGPFQLRSRLIGAFNAQNLLVALGLLLALGVELQAAVAALQTVAAPPGRMELWTLPSGVSAVVDYAHTPDALEKALQALRQHAEGALWCVFGCGGDRDRGKRPQMGAIAERLADHVVLTDDNPRDEDPDVILDDIASGLADARRAIREHDRAAAITLACARARPGDIVLVAGMGHEDSQMRSGQRRPYSDRVVVAALAGSGA